MSKLYFILFSSLLYTISFTQNKILSKTDSLRNKLAEKKKNELLKEFKLDTPSKFAGNIIPIPLADSSSGKLIPIPNHYSGDGKALLLKKKKPKGK